MSRARHRKNGGKVEAEAKESGVVDAHAGEHKSVPYLKRKCGGKVEGKSKMRRLDRPGRWKGGKCGADQAPLSTASKVSGPD